MMMILLMMIKIMNKIHYDSKTPFNLILRILAFPIRNFQKIFLKVVQRNAFLAHSEKVLIAMLLDKDQNVCRLAVNEFQFTKGNTPNAFCFALS